jgi:hypothetical protein
MSDSAPTFQTIEFEDALGSRLDFRGLRLPALTLDQMLAGPALQPEDAGEDPTKPNYAPVLLSPLTPREDATNRVLMVLAMPVRPSERDQ